jgi:tellurite resistance protein
LSDDGSHAAPRLLEHTEDLARRQLWLAALHHLALADGDFSPAEEQALIAQLRQELPGASWETLPLPGTAALLHRFGQGTPLAEAFLRSAVVVALADGHLSPPEMALLRQWSTALTVGEEVLAALPEACSDTEDSAGPLDSLKAWLDGLDPADPAVARFLTRLIPARCPFEREIKLFGHKIVHIPPMCTINPLYDQLVALRLRCLTSLEERDTRELPEDRPPTPEP